MKHIENDYAKVRTRYLYLLNQMYGARTYVINTWYVRDTVTSAT